MQYLVVFATISLTSVLSWAGHFRFEVVAAMEECTQELLEDLIKQVKNISPNSQNFNQPYIQIRGRDMWLDFPGNGHHFTISPLPQISFQAEMPCFDAYGERCFEKDRLYSLILKGPEKNVEFAVNSKTNRKSSIKINYAQYAQCLKELLGLN